MPSPSRIQGPTGLASMSIEPPAPRELTIPELKIKLVKRLEEKCGTKTMRWRLTHAFRTVDLGEKGIVSLAQWLRINDLLGCALDPRGATRLFLYYDTADGQRERSNVISQEEVIADLLACRVGRDEDVFAKHGLLDTGPPPGSKSKSNLPSHQGGVFAGGAWEDEWHRNGGTPQLLVDPASPTKPAKYPPPAPPASHLSAAAPKQGNASNLSSVEGGIFAPPRTAERNPPRKVGPYSNNPSLPGGIFAVAPAAEYVFDPRKKNSNQSSVPGGPFAPSTAMLRLGGA